MSSRGGYLLAGQLSELERLQLQARVWEPDGSALLEHLGDGAGLRVVDVGCGGLGWLRILSRWVGPGGSVTGFDMDGKMLRAARTFVEEEGLGNVMLVRDDLFDSRLPPGSFDLVHARFEIGPLGRAAEQLAAYLRLVRPGGRIVLEDPDIGSWHFNPPAPAAERLIALVEAAFIAAGGDAQAGRRQAALLREAGLGPEVRAAVHALPPGHPYLRLPLQFSVSLEPRLLALVSRAELEELRRVAEAEIAAPGRWGTTFTLIQTWATTPPAA
ncbi:MAG TPA: methyltransferase domain-containing protein [Thermomicrobiales bacterium]|nr:methyltransferase domain-containing protein [Thermomicrobiales bacterium]